jgi:hypothetical protein
MPNRLGESASAYLRQHRENPVDWYPWGEEAFARARSEDRPVFLSIGYSSCHWCHVMAHESFEHEAMAEVMNRAFVNIKVDREERPDVDETYMAFVQLLTGRGGWPLSVFLTPEKAPIFGGTYWPREDRGQQPGFRTICEQVAAAWGRDRAEIQMAAAQNAAVLKDVLQPIAPGPQPDGRSGFELAEGLVAKLGRLFDAKEGGFGTAPKFPPHTAIEFLLHLAGNRDFEGWDTGRALEMALLTLEKMALGGLHDHVGGGFHRYSTDGRWHLPHFEKTLYDNALLLANYARAARLSGREWCVAVARRIADWLEREMRSPEGFFYSALDADSDGEEGKFYVWHWEELMGLPDGAEFARAYGCEQEGNFADESTGRRTGANILHMSKLPVRAFAEQLDKLLELRGLRVRPGLDDKAVVSWNGLAIAGFAELGRLDTARQTARAVLEAESRWGRLPHLIGIQGPSGDAFLDDYAHFAFGLLELGGEFRAEAARLCDEMVERFGDPEEAGLFSSSQGHEVLFGSSKPMTDQPIPSANAVAARVLARLGRLQEARAIVSWAGGWMDRVPHGTEALHTAALELEGIAVKPVLVWLVGRVVRIVIASGYHLNANPAADEWLIPTEVRFEGASGRASYPAGVDGRYEGTVEIPFELEAGEQVSSIVVRFQACTESECLAPEEVTVGC